MNERQKRVLADKIIDALRRRRSTARRSRCGASRSSRGTDDIREAPALALIERLLAAGARGARRTIRRRNEACAQATRRPDRAASSINYDAAEGADALALRHRVARVPPPELPAPEGADAPSRVLFDGRNIWEPDEVRALGFTYYGIGL